MDNIEPVSRIEQYLDRMANGGSGDLPTPVSRIEQYLNQIAPGGGSGGGGGDSSVVLLNVVAPGALDKTWQEIHDMVTSGKVVYLLYVEDEGLYVFPCFLTMVYGDDLDNRYAAEFSYFNQSTVTFSFATDTPNGYPMFEA